MRCFDARDDGCALHRTRSCVAWVPVSSDPAEDDPVVCPACGTEHAPLREQRTLGDAVTVALVDDGVITWMERQVRDLDPQARRHRVGVGWELLLDDEDLEVVWLDRSASTRLATRAYASARPVVYVVTSLRAWDGRFRDDPWLAPLSLGEWFAGGRVALLDAVQRRRGPLFASEPAMRPWAPHHAHDPCSVTIPLGARVLVVEPQRATLDGHEVVSREGTSVLALLRLLVERWREDVADGKAAEAFCAWTPEDLREALKDTAGGSWDSASTVRRQLTRLRSGLRDRYQQATGIRLDEDAVIENVAGQGYRIHPTRVLAQLA